VVKKYFSDLKPIAITAFAFVLCGIPATIYLCFTDFPHILAANDKAMFSLLCLAALAIIGSALALIAYYYLIKFTTVLFAASVTYMIPVIAIIWGMADGESFKLIYLLWIALILIGVFLVNKKTGYEELQH
jgi:drug/metabolite transporter (DMT)-like permease